MRPTRRDTPFREAMRSLLVFDGAMGSLLYERGIFVMQNFEQLNVTRPDVVAKIHEDYVNAGADIIETNTFGANSFRLDRHGLGDQVRAFNLAGARLARKAAGEDVWVGGSIGPTGLVPGVDAARDVAGAKLMPDPKTTYRVLFDMVSAPAQAADVNPMLQTAAKYLNTLIKAGVPAEHRKIAIIIHGGGTPAILVNDAFKSRNGGQENPNIALMQALAKAGVELHVCGQGVLNAKIDRKDIQPEVQVDLWALTTIIELQHKGYVKIG